MERESDVCSSEQCFLYCTLTFIFQLYSKLLVGSLSLGMAAFPFIYLPGINGKKRIVCYDEKGLELPKLQGTGHPQSVAMLFVLFTEVILLQSWESQCRTTIHAAQYRVKMERILPKITEKLLLVLSIQH